MSERHRNIFAVKTHANNLLQLLSHFGACARRTSNNTSLPLSLPPSFSLSLCKREGLAAYTHTHTHRQTHTQRDRETERRGRWTPGCSAGTHQILGPPLPEALLVARLRNGLPCSPDQGYRLPRIPGMPRIVPRVRLWHRPRLPNTNKTSLPWFGECFYFFF